MLKLVKKIFINREIDDQPFPETTPHTHDGNNSPMLAPSSIGSVQIKSGAVGTAKIEDEAVWTQHLKALAVTEQKLADAAVATQKIKNGAVNAQKLIQSEAIITLSIQVDDAVIQSAHIGTGQILNAHIGNLQVTNAKIADLSADKITTGILTGRTVRTSATKPMVILDSTNFLQCYDATYLRVKLTTEALHFYDASGVTRAIIYGDSVGSVFKVEAADISLGVNINSSVTIEGEVMALGGGNNSIGADGTHIYINGLANAHFVPDSSLSNSAQLGIATNYWYSVHYGSGGLVSHSQPLMDVRKAIDIIRKLKNKSDNVRIDPSSMASELKDGKGENQGMRMDTLILASVGVLKDLDKRLSKIESSII